MLPSSLQRLRTKGYVIHEDGQPNIVVQRSPNRTAGEFDDLFTLVCKVEDVWVEASFVCTADPGVDWLLAPMNSKGTARVKAGQWPFKLGRRSESKGGYRCLVQGGPIEVTRDLDLDDQLDGDVQDRGWFGIQVHRANEAGTSSRVGRWSAGCIVIPVSAGEFEDLMDQIEARLEDPEHDIVLLTVLEAE